MEAKGDAATNDSPGGGPPTGPAGTDAMVNELGELLAQLEDQPENIPLLRHQIRLMKQLDMIAQVLDCVIRLSSLVMLSEGRSSVNTPAHGQTFGLNTWNFSSSLPFGPSPLIRSSRS